MGCIYLVTNQVNGKRYVGQTTKSLTKHRQEYKRMAASTKEYGMLLLRAIRKYGPSNFTWEVIESGVSQLLLDTREVECIAKYQTKFPNGYNLTDGGKWESGFRWCDFVLEKLSLSAKRRNADPAMRAMYAEAGKMAMQNPEVKAKHHKAISTPEFKTKAYAWMKDSEAYARWKASLKAAAAREDVKAKKRAAFARPESLAKRSASAKAAHARPETKARHKAAIKAALQRPEVKETYRLAVKLTNAKPEVRARKTAAIRRRMEIGKPPIFPFEAKIWGSVAHCFHSKYAAVSVLRVRKRTRCSRHLHHERANFFIVLSGQLIIEEWPEPKDISNIKVYQLKPGQSHTVPSGLIHRFRVLKAGEVVEIYWPDKGGTVRLDDIVRLDEGGVDEEDGHV